MVCFIRGQLPFKEVRHLTSGSKQQYQSFECNERGKRMKFEIEVISSAKKITDEILEKSLEKSFLSRKTNSFLSLFFSQKNSIKICVNWRRKFDWRCFLVVRKKSKNLTFRRLTHPASRTITVIRNRGLPRPVSSV